MFTLVFVFQESNIITEVFFNTLFLYKCWGVVFILCEGYLQVTSMEWTAKFTTVGFVVCLFETGLVIDLKLEDSA